MPEPFSHTCLFIDLETSSVRRERVDSDVSLAWLGGRGMGIYFLGLSPRIAPLDPENPLVFATGHLTGTRVPSSGRMVISAFSPLTNTICSCSVGGGLPLQMKKAGIDLIHLTGRAPRPCVVTIRDHSVTFSEESMPEDLPLPAVFEKFGSCGGSVTAVGPAAFRGCLYASIMVDSSFASGRGGLGLVMASKNLRAVVVEGSGSSRRLPADKDAVEIARKDIVRLFDASPVVMGRSGISTYGTSSLVDLMAARRMMPTANFRRTYFENYRAFSGPVISQRHRPGRYACHGCPIACKLRSVHDIPEYETLSHFGALNENDDLDSIIEANRLCNENGMDTISAAATIACLAEIRGTRYTGQTLVDMVRSITGSGPDAELLRLGSARLASELGAPERSMSVKGLELPAYDPRGAYGMALAYGTSTRGGCHLRAYPIAHEILRKPVATDRFSFAGKARTIKIAEDLGAVIDSIGACKFAFLAASLEEYARGFAAVTGLPYTTQDLMRIGESIYMLERHINTVRGFSRKDDMLPERFYRESGTPGPGIVIHPIDRAAYEDALDRYYRIRGCDRDGIVPYERIKGFAPCMA